MFIKAEEHDDYKTNYSPLENRFRCYIMQLLQ